MNRNNRIAATLYSLGTQFISGSINTLHKVDDDDDVDDNNNNNNNFKKRARHFPETKAPLY